MYPVLFSRVCLSCLQDSKELLEDILFPQELFPVPVAARGDVKRLFAVLLVLLVGQEVDDVLKKRRKRSKEIC